MGFPVRPNICVLSQRWRQGLIFGWLVVVGGRLQVLFPGSNQAQVPGRSREVWSHLPSTRRFLVSNSCHLDTDWTSGNQRTGRRCVKPHSRGFGCQRVTPELVCHLTILITFGWDGGSRVHTRLPGLRQGTTVCVHTSMDMEQQSDHKLIRPSGMGLLVCGAGSHPSYHLGAQEGVCQRGDLEPVRRFRITHPLGH